MQPSSEATLDAVTLTVETGDCLQAEAVLERIATESSTALQAEARISLRETEDEQVHLRIRAGSTESSRVLDLAGQSCAKQTATVALSLALALEFFIAGREEEPEPIPKPEPKPEPERAPKPESESEPVPNPRQWSAGAGFVVHSGVVLHPAVGGLVRAEHAWPRVAIRLGAQWSVSDRIALAPGRLRVHEIVGVPELCVRWPRPLATPALCGGARLGAAVARGLDFTQPRREASPWVSPMVSAEIRAPLAERVSIGVGAFVSVPIVRPRFIAGGSTLLGAPAFGGGAVDVTFFFGDR